MSVHPDLANIWRRPQGFEGTDHYGIRLANLSTAQRDALAGTTDAPRPGSTIWNTTAGAVETYDGSEWIGVVGVGGSTSVKRFGAVGDGVTDDTAAIQAAIDAAPANGNLLIPPGTYVCSSALTVSSRGTSIVGTRGKSILLFTEATDGISVADTPVQPATNFTLRDLSISTSNAEAGAAISLLFPLYAGQAVIENISIEKTGSGLWAYGVHGSNFQVGTITALRTYQSTDVGMRFENSSTALHIYNAEIVAGSRALEVDWLGSGETGCEVYVHGSTFQGDFTASAVWLGTKSFLTLSDVHFENTNGSPSDSADIVTAGTSAALTILSGGGGSVLTAGTNPALYMCFYTAGKAVTLGASSVSSFVFGSSMTALSGGGGLDIVVGNRLASGSMLPNKIGSYFTRADATTFSSVTGAQRSDDSALVIGNTSQVYALDFASNALPMWEPLNASDNSAFRWKTGKQVSFEDTDGNGRMFFNPSISRFGASGDQIGFYGNNGSVKQTVTGSRGSNAALASLLTALANLGLITDGSS